MKNKKKKSIEKELKRDKIMLLITSIIIVILLTLLIISRNYRDFSAVSINSNNNSIFTISDLTLNDLKYGSTLSEIKKELGNPKNEKDYVSGVYKYKTLKYDGLKLTLKENYDDYILVKAEITSKDYKIGRKIKVSDSILKTMKKFKVENKTGKYLYKNYSVSALNEEEITDTIYIGFRSNSKVTYVNKDATINNNDSNIAMLNITYKTGKITKIVWSYDVK